MSDEPIPREVREAYALGDAPAEPVSAGWINRTYIVERAGERVVVQRLHPIFRGEVNLDLEAITSHVAGRGLVTPRLVRTIHGRAWVEHGGVWRVLTFVEGRTLSSLDPAHARGAAHLLARFHRALEDLDHRFHFTRPGAHDTRAHLAKLERLLAERPVDPRLEPLAAAILARGCALPDLNGLPLRIVHGDPKATNVLFAHDGPEALALVDLDTLAHGTLAVELGDALRSWCNATDESDASARIDTAIFEAAVEGYARGAAGTITDDEIAAIVPGLETIALELASRFAADVVEDHYFGWDSRRFPSRREHNLARTRAQLALAESVARERARLEELVARAFRR
jgi:Ser/Thr protein kinase RdoA (MazF antagonist)